MALSKWFLCGAEGAFDRDRTLRLRLPKRLLGKGWGAPRVL